MIQPAGNMDDDKPISDALRYVYVSLAKCPACEEVDHRIYKTIKQDDGSKTQYARCKVCDHKFLIIWE